MAKRNIDRIRNARKQIASSSAKVSPPRRYFLFSAIATYKSDPSKQVCQFIAFEHNGFPSYREVRGYFHSHLAKVSLERAMEEIDKKMKSLIVNSFSEFKSCQDFLDFIKAR